MITQLKVENFRSIQKSEITFGKFTVLTGANNSGKSSYLYSLLVIKNLLSNSNQSIDNFFNFQNLINLGGFNEIVFDKNIDKNLVIEVKFKDEKFECSYQICLNPKISKISLKESTYTINLQNEVSFPYPANKNVALAVTIPLKTPPPTPPGTVTLNFNWNGIIGTFQNSDVSGEEIQIHQERITQILNLPLNEINKLDNVPIRRLFTKNSYSNISLQRDIMTEDEIATKVAIDSDLEENISHYLEKIIGKRFKVNKQLGTSIFRLETFDRNTRFNNDIVNDGLGTNQVVYILFKALLKDKSFICIDEPEIHLHPSIITKLVDALIEIAYEENKQFLISTHNEHLMSCLLASVADKKMKAEDLKVYYLTKNGKKTEVESQEVNEHGQISGGLKNFYEAELENWERLFHIAKTEV